MKVLIALALVFALVFTLRTVAWRCGIRVRGWLLRASTGCSSPSTRPNLSAWEWGCRSAVRSLKLITEDCGRPRTFHAVPFFNSHCRDTHMVRKKIVEDLCSIHMAANVSRRVFAERRIWRKCALLYHPASRACFSRHFGPGPRM